MLICLDLETTWFDPKNDEIIEIALVLFDERTGDVVKSYSSLVRPLRGVPQEILLLTHIEEEDLQSAPSLESIRGQIQDFLWNYPLVGHNVSFDIGFLLANKFSFSQKSYDTFLIANTFLFQLPSLSLASLCDYYNIFLKDAHRALADVEATIQLYQALKKDILSFSLQKQKIFSFFSKEILLPFPLPYNQLVAMEEIIEMLISLFPKQSSDFLLEETYPELSYEEVLSFFPQYAYRENQKKLYEICQATFSEQRKSIIEAPTGVGKTFAYLVPSILFALKNNKQVIISTKTKLLQDQICEKDIPFIVSSFKKRFIFTKIKWKNNYISIYNFFRSFQEPAFSKEKISFFLKIAFWLTDTKSWELEELTFYWEEYKYVDTISLQSDDTLSQKNPYLKYEFYQKILESIPKSQIVITNHNFVFSDIEKSSSSFLVYENCVFDEAHSLEDIATESLKINFSYSLLVAYLSRFWFSPSLNIVEAIIAYADQLESYLFFSFDIDRGATFSQIKSVLVPDTFSSEKIDLLSKELIEKISKLIHIIRSDYKGIFDDGLYLERLISFFSTFPKEQRFQYIYFLNIHPKTGA